MPNPTGVRKPKRMSRRPLDMTGASMCLCMYTTQALYGINCTLLEVFAGLCLLQIEVELQFSSFYIVGMTLADSACSACRDHYFIY